MKNLQPVKKIINGKGVEITPFPARFAIIYKFKILKTFGSPLLDLVKGPIAALVKLKQAVGKLTLDNVDTTIFNDLNSDLFSHVDPETATSLIFELLSLTSVSGRQLSEEAITELFTGNMIELYKILFAVLEVNYKDFLSVADIISPQDETQAQETQK